jgi:hypothetical protein
MRCESVSQDGLAESTAHRIKGPIMNTSRILLLAATATALAGSVTAASARDLSASADVVRGQVAGHAYQNGGVGKAEVTDMQRHMAHYDLHITFSEGRHNAYAADVKLRITDAAGKQVFGLGHAGPLTDVSLPPGHYRVVAALGGVQRTASVDVKPGRPAKLLLHWPKDAA